MIYVTGDCHGDYRRFDSRTFREQREMDRQDFVIVCGDFGYWDRSREQEYWLNWLAQKNFTLLFVDGNHENYDLLAELPVGAVARRQGAADPGECDPSQAGTGVYTSGPALFYLRRRQEPRCDGRDSGGG